MPKNGDARLPVRKMYKLFIDGAFVRSESGRSDPLWDGKDFGANIARASRKDVRDAVVAARRAQGGWWQSTPGTRGLVLYRLAEMLEARHSELVERLREGSELTRDDAEREVHAAIDRTIWYAGWCDKYAALLSTRNPVGGPHLNFSTPEPMGVVAILAPDQSALLALLSLVLPAIVAGNTVVVVSSQKDPRTAIAFAETVATCDLPHGVLNILTGFREELAPTLAKHMGIDAILLPDGNALFAAMLEKEAAENLKRVRRYPDRPREGWFSPLSQSLDDIAALCEIKTIWHPVGV